MQRDPGRAGIGPRELLDALAGEQVPIRGSDPYLTLYAAITGSSGAFERAGRGRYRWLPRNT